MDGLLVLSKLQDLSPLLLKKVILTLMPKVISMVKVIPKMVYDITLHPTVVSVILTLKFLFPSNMYGSIKMVLKLLLLTLLLVPMMETIILLLDCITSCTNRLILHFEVKMPTTVLMQVPLVVGLHLL